MNTALATDTLVHEAETQRQHIRVKLPGTIELQAGDGPLSLDLHDLSAGGLGFIAPRGALRVGQPYAGRLKLNVEGLALAIGVRFQVRHHDAASGRGGGSFDGLGASERLAIRRIVTAALSGDLVGVGDILHTLSRNNLTAPRDAASASPPTGGRRLRAAAISLLITAVGIAALLYGAGEIHERLFGASSLAARVSGPSYAVTMPRDGVFHSLVPADGVVRKGAPLGQFDTSMLDLVREQAAAARLDSATLDSLLQRSVKGTITSPCDCRVLSLLAADGQYVGKNQPLAELVPMEFEPFVTARFRYPQAERIQPGTDVAIRISGELGTRRGTVVQVRDRGTDALSDEIIATVKPDTPIDRELLSRRSEVSLSGNGLLASAISLLGVGPARAGGAQP